MGLNKRAGNQLKKFLDKWAKEHNVCFVSLEVTLHKEVVMIHSNRTLNKEDLLQCDACKNQNDVKNCRKCE